MNITEIEEEPLYYFAYGMLTNPEFIDGTEIGKAELRGYRLELTQFANIVKDPSSTVFGALWALEPGFLDELDKVEGYPTLYRRKMIRVTVDGKIYNALAYYLTPQWRKELRDGVPSKKYLSHIAQGYNHFGIPLSQLATQQIVEDTDEKEMIQEVPMHPGAYAQSLKQGAAQGMIMGFEAEVLIPSKTIDAVMAKPKKKVESKEERLARIYDYWNNASGTEDFVVEGLGDDWVDFKTQLKHGTTGFTVAKQNKIFAEYADWASAKVKPIFAAATTAIQNKAWNKYVANRREFNKPPPQKTKLDDVRNFVSWLMYGFQSPFRIKINDIATPLKFIRDKYTTLQQFIESNGLALKPDAWDINVYNGENDEDAGWDWDGEGSDNAPMVMKQALTKYFSEPKVFSRYHQKKKDAVSWYIEPDGSLDPNKQSDGSAEIVSPPEPVMTNLENLKKFYDLAKEYELYTNESTGLHININIPKTNLDVLKLAVFLGDKYILKEFNRENSDYCESIVNALQSRDQKNIILKDNTLTALTSLVKLAQRYSKDHNSSISFNGKYVSFRHTGGNYLAEFDKVYNVVLRFVRAFVIATDPNAYKNEYMGKVVKMFGTTIAKPKEPTQIINGVPVWATLLTARYEYRVRASDSTEIQNSFTKIPYAYYDKFMKPLTLSVDEQIKYIREKMFTDESIMQYLINDWEHIATAGDQKLRTLIASGKVRLFLHVLTPPAGLDPTPYLKKTRLLKAGWNRGTFSKLSSLTRKDPTFLKAAKIFLANKKEFSKFKK